MAKKGPGGKKDARKKFRGADGIGCREYRPSRLLLCPPAKHFGPKVAKSVPFCSMAHKKDTLITS
jgi:hypothetical protein